MEDEDAAVMDRDFLAHACAMRPENLNDYAIVCNTEKPSTLTRSMRAYFQSQPIIASATTKDPPLPWPMHPLVPEPVADARHLSGPA